MKKNDRVLKIWARLIVAASWVLGAGAAAAQAFLGSSWS